MKENSSLSSIIFSIFTQSFPSPSSFCVPVEDLYSIALLRTIYFIISFRRTKAEFSKFFSADGIPAVDKIKPGFDSFKMCPCLFTSFKIHCSECVAAITFNLFMNFHRYSFLNLFIETHSISVSFQSKFYKFFYEVAVFCPREAVPADYQTDCTLYFRFRDFQDL